MHGQKVYFVILCIKSKSYTMKTPTLLELHPLFFTSMNEEIERKRKEYLSPSFKKRARLLLKALNN